MSDSNAYSSRLRAQVIERQQILTFAPSTTMQDLLFAWQQQCLATVVHPPQRRFTGMAIATEQELQGFIFPEHFLSLLAEAEDLTQVIAQEILLPVPTGIPEEALQNPLIALDRMHEQAAELLPIIDDQGQWQGLITCAAVQQLLWSDNLLGLRTGQDLIEQDIAAIAISPHITLLQAAKALVETPKKCLMVMADATTTQTAVPQGFFTSIDLLSAAAAGVNLGEEFVHDWLTQPPLTVTSTDSLLQIAQALEQHQQWQAAVLDPEGQFVGEILWEDILQVLDPIALYWQSKLLRHQVGKLTRKEHQLKEQGEVVAVRHRPYRVLLIENVVTESPILNHLLNPPDNMGLAFQVIQVDNLATAIAQLKTEHYDIAIADLNLPDSQGYATFESIKPYCTELPILLLIEDDAAQAALTEACLKNGAQDYLLRSLCEGSSQTEREILMRSIRYALDYQGVQHRLKEKSQQLAGLNLQLQQEIVAKTEIANRLQASDAQVKAIFEAIADIIFVIDPNNWQIQRVTLDTQSTYPQRLNLPQATLDFLQNNQADLKPLLERAATHPQILYHEYAIQSQPDHPRLWFSASIAAVNPTQVVWVAHDITPIKQAQQELFSYQQELEAKVEQRTQQLQSLNAALTVEINRRKYTEAELRQERNFLSTLFNLAGALFVVLDQHGRIIRFNPACEKLTGYSFDEVFGKYVWDLFLRTEDTVAMMHEFRRLLTEKTANTYESDWRTKFGQLHRISWSNTVLLNEDGNVRYIISTGMDISDRRAFEVTLKTLNQELESRVEQRTKILENIEQNLRRQLAAVDAAVDAIAILQQGNFVSVNPAFLDLFGYPHLVSLSGQQWQQILFAPSEQIRVTEEIMPALETQNSWQGEAIAQHQDGSTFIQEISLTITEDGDLICVCRDITSRNEAEAKLRATEELLRVQYRNFPIPTYTWQHRDGDFYLINFNAAAESANDYQLKEFFGFRSSEIYGKDHEIHQNIHTCFETKSTFEKELQSQYQSPRKEKRLLRYLVVTYVYIEPDLVMVHTQDLTERKRAESDLKQSQAFLRQVIDNDPNLIFVKDREGRFRLANQATAEIYGTTINQLIGKRDADFNPHSDEVEHFVQYDRRVIDSGQSAIIDEEKLTDSAGEVHYFRTVKIPLKLGSEEKHSQLLGVASEVTQQRQAKIELEKALAQERELNHLKSRFIDTASHEFRTPLTVILGATQILEAYYDQLPSDRRAKHLKNIQSSVERIRSLIDDVLTMSRLEAGKLQCERQPVDILALCRDLIDQLQIGIGKNHSFTFTTAGAIATPLQLDPNLLQHILSNLLSNACKYSPDHSVVSLHLIGTDKEINFTVKDQGIGIPEADQAHLFESFYRASNTHTIPGTGLGLNIVKEYVQLHGGNIDFVSQLNQGSEFYVTIPL